MLGGARRGRHSYCLGLLQARGTRLISLLLAQTEAAQPLSIFLQSLGASGPWAVLAGFLLIKIIEAWQGDRATMLPILQQLTPVLTEVRDSNKLLVGSNEHVVTALQAMTASNEAMTKAQERLVERLDREGRGHQA